MLTFRAAVATGVSDFFQGIDSWSKSRMFIQSGPQWNQTSLFKKELVLWALDPSPGLVSEAAWLLVSKPESAHLPLIIQPLTLSQIPNSASTPSSPLGKARKEFWLQGWKSKRSQQICTKSWP